MDAEIFRDLKQLDEKLNTVEYLLESCAKLFANYYSEATNDSKRTFSWPYSIQRNLADVVAKWPNYRGKVRPKLSPSTCALCGWAVSRLSGPGTKPPEGLREAATESAKRLAPLPPGRLESTTFEGEDAIFLHAQVLRFLAFQEQSKNNLYKDVLKKVRRVIANPSQTLHSFQLHYCVLALEEVRSHSGTRNQNIYSDKLRQRLKTEIMSQISYASSSDESRLDIGALAYSLASALRTDALRPATPLARKALAIIFEHQQGGRWSEIQPMSRTAVGFVHFPLKIEIANALLSILLRDLNAGVQLSWVQIDEIMGWVGGTVNEVGEYRGWCSEHDYDPNRIDFYVTAQVVQFLMDYRDLRRSLVTQSALERAGLVPQNPKSVPITWVQLGRTDLVKSRKNQIKSKLESYFVVPYEESKTLSSSSLLLYGPPGTSKTSLMQALANKLGWQFLQITPADFLSAGEQQVESRATLLFEILKRAQNLVVLFDEIDEFLLDREASDRPGGIFRFMTTSMLPKLQSLKSRRRLIFGIATNYRERLDKAITRLGRVDETWAILPPDFKSRVELIQKFEDGIDVEEAEELAANTPFFSYLELERAVLGREKQPDPWKVVPHPTASPEAYNNRPRSDDEFMELLKTQINDSVIGGASAKTIKALKNQLKELEKKSSGPDKLFSNTTVKTIQRVIARLG